ncbi:mechanosensitive ion channel family protein [Bartonella tamiae]|uniref:mechanosensitive ion channel family protein n=1 Tax=Bartonella tamiae TaxID=373638 RepID=UPI0018C8D228|nr:mechanosensitive ion channel domain-containing protein [Bartonella tamiae]
MNDFLAQHAWLETALWLVGLIILAIIVKVIFRAILTRAVQKIALLLHSDKSTDVDQTIRHITNVAPALIFTVGVRFVPSMPPALTAIIQNVSNAFIILTIMLAISSMLNVVNRIYERRPEAKLKPIKGLIQIVKLAMFAIGAILILATLIDRSPLILLSGLGAMAAVLILVFQDTLLSLVAGIQISSTDMVRVGDWIEIPHLSADGEVTEIALHTVKVQNFDNTVSTVPIRKLVTDPFKNWRAMQESGGRRIKRSLNIDQASINFLKDEERQHLSHLNLLEDYFKTKDEEIKSWNSKVQKNIENADNTRRMTNIGTFRAYVMAYLENHPGINQTMTLLVRQLEPSPEGLPIEIYCFTNTVAWAGYETIQSDIFDHLYSILPSFGLRVFQNPSGNDFNGVVIEAEPKHITHKQTEKKK